MRRNDRKAWEASLGIAIHNMRQGECIRYETLFRDETVGPWMRPMARSMCACCGGRWIWAGFTK